MLLEVRGTGEFDLRAMSFVEFGMVGSQRFPKPRSAVADVRFSTIFNQSKTIPDESP